MLGETVAFTLMTVVSVAVLLLVNPPQSADHSGWGRAALPLFGIVHAAPWLIGIVLIWKSRHLHHGEKLLATLVLPLGPTLVLWLARPLSPGPTASFAAGHGTQQSVAVWSEPSDPQNCIITVSNWVFQTMELGVVLATVVVALVVLLRLRRRMRPERPAT